jgi:hypothetical protein
MLSSFDRPNALLSGHSERRKLAQVFVSVNGTAQASLIWSFIRGDNNNLHELWTLHGCYAYASHHPQLNAIDKTVHGRSYKNLSTLPFLTYLEVLRLETSCAWSGRREPIIDGTMASRCACLVTSELPEKSNHSLHSNLIRFHFRLNWNLKPPMMFITYLFLVVTGSFYSDISSACSIFTV